MSKKVYELANELNISSVDLVTKLRDLGFNVRNHMVALTEAEVESAMKALNPPSAEKDATKKKAIKKKVVSRKVVKKDEAEDSEASEVSEEKIETAPVETTPEVVETVETASETGLEEEAKVAAAAKAKASTVKRRSGGRKEEDEISEDGTRDIYRGDMPRGLSIVSRPVVAPKSETRDSDAPRDKNKVYKEKMHSFTPVFTPVTKEEIEEEKNNRQKLRNPDEEIMATDPDGEGKDKKKRFGDLAAIVNKNKAPDKTKDINLLRAEEELKFAHGIVGSAIYTPAKKKKVYVGETRKTLLTEVKDSKRVVQVHGGCTAEELAQKLSQKFEAFANKVLEINLLVAPQDYLGVGLVTEISALWNYRVENRAFDENKILEAQAVKSEKSDLPLRNPIITIMGHVDHGKTTLLDYIRTAKVASGEAGGITQHIGAYSVKMKDKAMLTFLDTPGHAAFAAMRQRGANVTDIVVLVVAADDGVMPQTKESIKFIQNAKVPMIVAINKMDKPGVNPDKIKQGLMEFGITPEEWGGDTIFVPVSALTGLGVDQLLESIQLQAEVMELRETPAGPAEGIVIESKIETGRGPVCTVIVQKGTLKKGDSIVIGEFYGRARSLMDFEGKMVDSAGPSTPIQILGMNGVVKPGDTINVVANEREAKRVAEHRIDERKALENAGAKKLSLEDFFAADNNSEGGKKVLQLIVRSDVQGSFEAIKTAVEVLGNSEVGVQVLGGGVGPITDNDVLLAHASKGYIIGFNMRPVTTARKLAEDKGVDIKTYSIIYELIDDITLALEGMLTPEVTEKYIGRAQVRDTFSIPRIGVIAGSYVIDGKIERGCNIRLLRDGKIMHDGKLSSLKRFKDDAKEVKNGFECGIALENYTDIRVNDVFEAYIMEEKKRTLDQQATL